MRFRATNFSNTFALFVGLKAIRIIRYKKTDWQ